MGISQYFTTKNALGKVNSFIKCWRLTVKFSIIYIFDISSSLKIHNNDYIVTINIIKFSISNIATSILSSQGLARTRFCKRSMQVLILKPIVRFDTRSLGYTTNFKFEYLHSCKLSYTLCISCGLIQSQLCDLLKKVELHLEVIYMCIRLYNFDWATTNTLELVHVLMCHHAKWVHA